MISDDCEDAMLTYRCDNCSVACAIDQAADAETPTCCYCDGDMTLQQD